MPKSSKRTGCGCAGCLMMSVGLLVIGISLLGVGYIALVHTSLSIRAGATLFEWMAKDRGLSVNGISGSLSSDILVKSVKWDRGEIIDLRIRHDGLRAIWRDRKFVVREAQARMMHLDFNRPVITGVVARAEDSNRVFRAVVSLVPLAGGCNGLLEINRVALSGAVLTNSATGFSALVPACSASKPENLLQELLARAFYRKDFVSLTMTEQAEINKQVLSQE